LYTIPPEGDKEPAADAICAVVAEIEEAKPDAAVIITGDFKNATLSTSLPLYTQYINNPTRGESFLDKMYCNIRNAYTAKGMPPIGRSDHIIVYLLPTYVRKLKAQKPITKTQVWSKESVEELNGCFACTDWGIFQESCSDLNELTDTINEYIKFCEDNIIPKKTVKIYFRYDRGSQTN
jgi:hypothetical protein